MTTSTISTPTSHPRIALLTPLKDEEQYIGAMITSIVNQTIRPERWIIVDDGSTDQTASIVQSYCRRFPFIELVQLPARTERRPGGEGAIACAFERISLSRFDYLARFDADLVFPVDYFARLIEEFLRDPSLGIAGGSLYVRKNGLNVPESAPEYHVRGALKMYRVECLQQLGTLGTQIGWDTIDEVYAWSRGWRTHSFADLPVLHRRPTGGGLHASRVYKERGRAEYLTWSHPGFVALKSAKLALTNPTHAWSFLRGFLGCYLAKQDRLSDPLFRQTRRRQQMARLLMPITIGRTHTQLAIQARAGGRIRL
jgi:biofilm PGA synthesis N-glycosyltransferase PgaC